MRWTALVPIKQGGGAKSRLSAVLAEESRRQLASWMASHVLNILSKCDQIDESVILSPEKHDDPCAAWAKDHGRGLNPEIAAFRNSFGPMPLLMIHADLPLLSGTDIDSLLFLAEQHGAALATDRTGRGTNALALADGRDFTFCFGLYSRQRHCVQDTSLPVLQRTGLSADLDTIDDLRHIKARGFDFRTSQY